MCIPGLHLDGNNLLLSILFISFFVIPASVSHLNEAQIPFHGDRTPMSFPENEKKKKRAALHDVCQEQQQLQLSLS